MLLPLLNILSSSKNVIDIKHNSLLNLKLLSKYALNYNKINENSHSLRIFKSDDIYNTVYFKDIESTKNIIACLDYIITDKAVDIDYLWINSRDFNKHYSNYNDIYNKNNNINVNFEEKEQIKKSLLNHSYNVAKFNNLDKVKIDVHSNLYKYEREYKNEGFILSNIRCVDNPYWIEAHKNI
jgi:hypothetical protein